MSIEGLAGKVWRNGVQVGTFTALTTLPDLSGSVLTIGSIRAGLTFYAATIEDVTLTAAWRAENGRGAWTVADAVAAIHAADLAMGYT